MVNSNACIAWRLFHLNWIPIAVMGGVLLFGVIRLRLLVRTGRGAHSHGDRGGAGADRLSLCVRQGRPGGSQADLFAGRDFATVFRRHHHGAADLRHRRGQLAATGSCLAGDRPRDGDGSGAIARYVNDHDWLSGLLLRAYGLIKIMLLAVPVALTLTLRWVRLQVFVFAFSIALIITVAISTFVPAVGTWYGLDIAPAQFAALDSSLYTAQLRDILALRDGSLHYLEMFKLTGIVSFPSFHAASAVLYMWALWPVRVRRRHRGRAQSADDRLDAGDRRALHDRRLRRRSAGRDLDPARQVLPRRRGALVGDTGGEAGAALVPVLD